ncbi:OmpA family protein [Actinomyces bovis]|nr:OmpA family protein [Actinomyces bovis]
MRNPTQMLLTRRRALSLPLLTAVAGTLAACGDEARVPAPSASPTSAPKPAGSATAGVPPTTGAAATTGSRSYHLEGVLDGHTLDVQLGPLVRVDDKFSILPIHVDRPANDPSTQALAVEPRWLGGLTDDLLGIRPMRLVDSTSRSVWITTFRGNSSTTKLEAGASADFFATFGVIAPETTKATVMLSRSGCLEVEVVDQAAAPNIQVEQIRQQAKADTEHAQAINLECYTESYDGNISDRRTEDEIVLTAANDLTFATDSADLSSAAEAVLSNASQTIKTYPDGGTMTITGHTDDVADEAYNQTLSEKRAQSVHKRLGEFADLSKWQVSAVGKGETEPKVKDTTDEARAANRRVEISIKPTGGTKGGTRPVNPGAPMPAPTGPSAPGPQGLEVPDPGKAGEFLHIKLEKVVRRGSLLFGEFIVSGSANAALDHWFTDSRGWGLANARGELGGLTSIVAASGPTLLAGGGYVFPVDYLPQGARAHRPLADLDLVEEWKGKQATRVCVVWPDTGESTVTVERPDDAKQKGSRPVWRLTDVPVVEG